MGARNFQRIRFAGVFLVAFLLCGCATYPAFDDPNIDYNGRWGSGDGGTGAYYNPYDYVDSIENMYRWSDGTYGSYYHYQSGDDPQRYWHH